MSRSTTVSAWSSAWCAATAIAPGASESIAAA
jgi:hypothetical protein